MEKEEKIPDAVRSSGKDLPFKVPESYFETLPGRIRERLPDPAQRQGGTRVRKLRPVLAAAAMFIGLIVAGYGGFRILTDRGNQVYLSGDILEESIEYLAYDVDEEMLISALAESGISLSAESYDPQTDEIIQYLSEEEIEYSDIIYNY
jgi:hypothetical protein